MTMTVTLTDLDWEVAERGIFWIFSLKLDLTRSALRKG